MHRLFIWAAARWLMNQDLFNLLIVSKWSIQKYIDYINPQYLARLTRSDDIKRLEYIQACYKSLNMHTVVYVYGTAKHTEDTYAVSINDPNMLVYDIKTALLYDGWLDVSFINQLKYKQIYEPVYHANKLSAGVISNLMSDNFNTVSDQFENFTGSHLYTTNKLAHVLGSNIVQLILHYKHSICNYISRNNETASTSAIISDHIANYILANEPNMIIDTDLMSYGPYDLIRTLWLNGYKSNYMFSMITRDYNEESLALKDPDFVFYGLVYALEYPMYSAALDTLLRKAVTMNELDDIMVAFDKHSLFKYTYKHTLNQGKINDSYNIFTLTDLFHFINKFGFIHGFVIQESLISQLNKSKFISLEPTQQLMLISALYTCSLRQLVIVEFIDEVRALNSNMVKQAAITGIKAGKILKLRPKTTNEHENIALLLDIPYKGLHDVNVSKWFTYRCWNILRSANIKINVSAYNALIYADTPFDIAARSTNQELGGINDPSKRKDGKTAKTLTKTKFNMRVWIYFADDRKTYLKSCKCNPSIDCQIDIFTRIQYIPLTVEHLTV
jgi:hypothetical protein